MLKVSLLLLFVKDYYKIAWDYSWILLWALNLYHYLKWNDYLLSIFLFRSGSVY